MGESRFYAKLKRRHYLRILTPIDKERIMYCRYHFGNNLRFIN